MNQRVSMGFRTFGRMDWVSPFRRHKGASLTAGVVGLLKELWLWGLALRRPTLNRLIDFPTMNSGFQLADSHESRHGLGFRV